jgi:hypothetical protein
MKTTSRVLALSALVFSAACFAQTSPADPGKNTGESGKGMAMTGDADWDALDSNKDGKLSMDEWKAYGKNKK